jgi:HPt (histidine-containing phosphotransfer) domain-containing protein
MTASVLTIDRDNCYEAGMDDFISKPVALEELIEKLRACTPLRQDEANELMLALGLPSEAEIDSLDLNLPTLDHDILDYFCTTLCNGDMLIADELTTSYITNARLVLPQLEEALGQRKIKTVRRLAHTLKSSSQMFGALLLSEHCKRLEEIETPTQAHMRLIANELPRVAAALSASNRNAQMAA